MDFSSDSGGVSGRSRRIRRIQPGLWSNPTDPTTDTSGRPNHARDALDSATAEALIGIDTIWGGDVMNPSGVGRFIADCWFSNEPLPAAYTHPAAAVLRAKGGVGTKAPDVSSIDSYSPQSMCAAPLPGCSTDRVRRVACVAHISRGSGSVAR